jgi:ferrous iron transport protein B
MKSRSKKIILIGKPNSGKSLLFNRLTGLHQKVANYPGVTVDISRGQWGEFELVDFPGSYSMNPVSADEEVAVSQFQHFLEKEDVHCVVCVLDATLLERSLTFGLQALETVRKANVPLVFALNLYDEVQKNKLNMNVLGLQAETGVPFIPISAKSGFGIQELKINVFKDNPVRQEPLLLSAVDLTKKYGFGSSIFIKRMNMLDNIFLSNFLGALLFFAIMFVIFQSIFTWAVPLMDVTEQAVLFIGELIGSLLPSGFVNDFVQDAVIGGIGTFVVFVPQIFILTLIIGLLEDSGYLSRVAVICHRPLKMFGLSGKSFIPFLSGHACAIPAIYATRMIESKRVRFATMLTIPLISCSARLPIYSLFIVALIPRDDVLFGFFSLQGVAFFGLYIFGYLTAMIMSAVISKMIARKKNVDSPFIVELPAYRLPILKPLFRRSLKGSWQFLSEAGPIIFVTSVVVWFLGYFPNGNGQLNSSWLSELGHFIQPVLDPLGVDWKFGVAILTSFIAREVFVSTLGTLNGIESAEESVSGLAQVLNADGLTLASGVALLLFYSIALQCVSTLATIKRETKTTWIPAALFVAYTGLAYLISVIAYAALT